MTNYERIKNMSVENLSVFLAQFTDCESCPFNTITCWQDYHRNCGRKMFDWLNEEVEE